MVIFYSLIASLIMLRGFVLMILWNWYVTPLGLPEIGLIQSFSILLVATVILFTEEKREVDLESLILFGVGYPTLALIFGFILHYFM